MPWRETSDPYMIFVSEVMLQQTQVDRVKPKYEAFIFFFPNFRKLAGAPLPKLYGAWQGLGYNRRALGLKKSAQKVTAEYGGKLPQTLEELEALPGIGPATAASITAFAFNQPVVFIETNIRRVFLHHFFADKKNVDDAKIRKLVEITLDKKNPREWYWALMDYGSYLAKTLPKNPNQRSRHYAKQSAFKGSKREARGAIIRFLLKEKTGTSTNIIKNLKLDTDIVRAALHDLEKENVVEKVRGLYKLKEI